MSTSTPDGSASTPDAGRGRNGGDASGSRGLRLASYNIRFGGHRREARLAEVIGSLDADVTVLQEATHHAVVDEIARRAGYDHVVRRPGWSVAAMSRLPFAAVAWHRVRVGRGFLDLDLGPKRPRIVGVHLRAGLSRRGERLRQLEAADLLTVVGAPTDRPTILIGDFNAVAPGDGPTIRRMPLWIRLLLRFDGGIRHETMGALLEAGYVDTFRRLHPTDDGFTMPSVDPSCRLDYGLIGERFVDRVVECRPASVPPTLAATASDHLPLVVDLAS
jgi:endonuclease/exonuclease/phosphatase family metal-dependent hydrolase